MTRAIQKCNKKDENFEIDHTLVAPSAEGVGGILRRLTAKRGGISKKGGLVRGTPLYRFDRFYVVIGVGQTCSESGDTHPIWLPAYLTKMYHRCYLPLLWTLAGLYTVRPPPRNHY